jgi:hypothetical protein
LRFSSEWQRTIEYRDTWVHQQPPIVKGTGITYKRERRWKQSKTGNSYELGIGGGDEGEYSIDDLLRFIRPGLFQFTDKLAEIVEFYISELVEKDITIGKTGLKIKC